MNYKYSLRQSFVLIVIASIYFEQRRKYSFIVVYPSTLRLYAFQVLYFSWAGGIMCTASSYMICQHSAIPCAVLYCWHPYPLVQFLFCAVPDVLITHHARQEKRSSIVFTHFSLFPFIFEIIYEVEKVE